METLMPNGERLREFFENEEAMEKRRRQLEGLGGKVQRVLRVHEGHKFVHEDRNKYTPHQGKKEIERRKRKLAANVEATDKNSNSGT